MDGSIVTLPKQDFNNKPLQRITNQKVLANKKLFNDKSAKSFYEKITLGLYKRIGTVH